MTIPAPLHGTVSEVDPGSLFGRAEALFRNRLTIERFVYASSDQRALFVSRDSVLKRRVALRVHLQPGSPGRAWFERETQVLAALDHPMLRPVYSAGYVDHWAFSISKWIEGESLLAAVARGPRPLPDVIQLARDLVNAIEYAHAQRIVLRRIVPATLMLDRAGRAVITDLRYANRCLDVAGPDEEAMRHAFLAPETRGGQPGDPSSDIYTVGALLYYAVTGIEPAIDAGALRSPRELRPNCPRAVERMIMRALQREPQVRYLTAAEMGGDLASDIGEFNVSPTFAPPLGAGTEDSRSWEKRLRRALGDEYELLDELGAGGFGRVYRVRDLRLEREEALKILHPFLTTDPAVVERFRREAQLAGRLLHPNIVSIYDTGGRAGLLWYTMTYVNGKSLALIVQTEGPQPVDRVVRLLLESLAALQHSHSQGLVHRDLKPENMLIESTDGSVRIADFGLALAFQGPDRYGGASSRSGTPEFAAPEQLLGEPVDHRADLYSLTVVAFYALTGKPPFSGSSVEAIAAQKAVGVLPDIREVRSDVPEGLIEALERGASQRPADRFASAEEYATAIRDAVRAERSSSPWLARVFGGR